MIVIGVDPGTIRTGYGVLRRDGTRVVRLASGTIGSSPSSAPWTNC